VRSWYSFNTRSGSTWEQLISISTALNSLTNISSSSFALPYAVIESEGFHVWGVATDSANAESWSGASATNGRTLLTQPAFIYNSANNKLSTGNNLKAMSGGGDRHSLPWMAAALFNGTYVGMIIWSFRNRLLNSSGVDIGARNITNLSSIFYPVLNGLSFHSIIPTAIDGAGNIIATDSSGASGYNYSSGTSATANGYYNTTSFSADDGFWAFSIGDRIEGDSGPSYKNPNGFGFGNFNAGDTSSDLYWNGSLVSTSGYVGLLFCDDL
jgi:hypothetical protein